MVAVQNTLDEASSHFNIFRLPNIIFCFMNEPNTSCYTTEWRKHRLTFLYWKKYARVAVCHARIQHNDRHDFNKVFAVVVNYFIINTRFSIRRRIYRIVPASPYRFFANFSFHSSTEFLCACALSNTLNVIGFGTAALMNMCWRKRLAKWGTALRESKHKQTFS